MKDSLIIMPQLQKEIVGKGALESDAGFYNLTVSPPFGVKTSVPAPHRHSIFQTPPRELSFHPCHIPAAFKPIPVTTLATYLSLIFCSLLLIIIYNQDLHK